MGPLAKSLLIAAGAALGANARYWLGGWIASRIDQPFPWATLLINVTGSLLIGLFLGLSDRQGWPMHWRLLVAVGFAGGYTTFSAFSWETLALMERGRMLPAVAYVGASVLACVAACWVGVAIARSVALG
jgi:fluoride exporter